MKTSIIKLPGTPNEVAELASTFQFVVKLEDNTFKGCYTRKQAKNDIKKSFGHFDSFKIWEREYCYITKKTMI